MVNTRMIESETTTPPRPVQTPPPLIIPMSNGAQHAKEAVSEGMATATRATETMQAETKKHMEKMQHSAHSMMALGQGNFQAMMEAGRIWSTGIQALAKSASAASQTRMEESATILRSLAGIKTLQDGMEMQAKLLQSTIEGVLEQAGQINTASIALAKESMAPITARCCAAASEVQRAA